MPGAGIVRSIYSAIMEGHVAGAGLDEGVARLAPRLVDATIELHRMVGARRPGRPTRAGGWAATRALSAGPEASTPMLSPTPPPHRPFLFLSLTRPPKKVMHNFLPSAVKFHYQFNLREMSNVVGGLCRMTKEEFRDPLKVGGAEAWGLGGHHGLETGAGAGAGARAGTGVGGGRPPLTTPHPRTPPSLPAPHPPTPPPAHPRPCACGCTSASACSATAWCLTPTPQSLTSTGLL
jgi:hypothetical protein